MSDLLDTAQKTEFCEAACVPFTLLVGSSHPYRAELVLAAVALTMCRWTGETEVAVAVTDSHSDEIDERRVMLFNVDDQMMVDDFLKAVSTSETPQATHDRATDSKNLDLVIASDLPDLSSGEIRFTTEISDGRGFVADLAAALEGLAAGNGRLEDLRCIAPRRRHILDALIGADVPVVGIDTLFLEQVQRSPQQVAVWDVDLELTYEQLSHAADQYADVLRRAGVCAGDKVVIAIRPSAGEAVAVLSIVRLGAIYAGFVDDDPEARAKLMLDKLAPVVAVVDTDTSDHPALRNLNRVDAWRPGMCDPMDTKAVFSPTEQDAAHSAAFISFTSGTTGEPKGVVITQKAITRLALSPELHINADDHVLRMAPLTFDTSQFEIWGALLNGATLEVFPSKLPVIGEIEAFFNERKISVAWITAGLFRLIAKSRPQAFAGLRWIVTGGEVVPHDSAACMLDMHPRLVITNGYGPTENTTFTTTFTVRSSTEISGPLPVGRPIAGTKVFILDRNARLVPPGAVGELYAGGTGVADGYLDDVPETRRRFGYFCPDLDERLYRTGDLVRLDSDGNVLFLGRVDTQIKLNGYRIELEEISSTLTRHPDVLDAVVIVSKQADRESRLIAAVVAQVGAEPAPQMMRKYLSEFLPSYAIPSLWVVVDEIPITRHGKVAEKTLIKAAKPAELTERMM